MAAQQQQEHRSFHDLKDLAAESELWEVACEHHTRGRAWHRRAEAAHLVSVHDAHDLVGRDLDAVRVDLHQGVVQIAGFAVGLVWRPVPAGHIHHVRAEPRRPLALLLVFAIVQQIHRALAACHKASRQSTAAHQAGSFMHELSTGTNAHRQAAQPHGRH